MFVRLGMNGIYKLPLLYKSLINMNRINNKTLNLGDINVDLYSNGNVIGLTTKRLATVEETRYIFYNIFGINISDLDDFDQDIDEYNYYNTGLTEVFNGWLKGKYGDQSIMEYAYDCNDEQLGLFNLIPLIIYLKEKEII